MKYIASIIILLATIGLQAQESIKTYFDNAKTHLKSEHKFTQQGAGKMYHGDFKEFYENGKIKISGGYALGQLHGDYYEYNTDEKVILKCRYTNGILNGEHKTFFPSGNISERRLFINGKLQGDRKYYSDVKDSEPQKIEKYQMGQKL